MLVRQLRHAIISLLRYVCCCIYRTHKISANFSLSPWMGEWKACKAGDINCEYFLLQKERKKTFWDQYFVFSTSSVAQCAVALLRKIKMYKTLCICSSFGKGVKAHEAVVWGIFFRPRFSLLYFWDISRINAVCTARFY